MKEQVVRQATWAHLGKDITPETILVSGIPEELAFTVHKEHMGFMNADNQFVRIEGTSTVINDMTGAAYGPVSDNYAAVSNSDALGVLQYIDGLELKKYGETQSGMQFIIGQLADVTILGDSFTPYLIFRNSFNGRYPIQAAITPLRIVCQNQLTMAFRNAENTYNIRHTSKAVERLEEAQRILLNVDSYMRELNKTAEKYAAIKLSDYQQSKIIAEMFPIKDDMTERQKNVVTDKIAALKAAIRRDDNRNFKGTAWGLVNAYSDYISHNNQVRQTKTAEENRFISVSFDPTILQKMMATITRMAA